MAEPHITAEAVRAAYNRLLDNAALLAPVPLRFVVPDWMAEAARQELPACVEIIPQSTIYREPHE